MRPLQQLTAAIVLAWLSGVASAASLRLAVTDLSELYNLSNEPFRTQYVGDMNERRDFVLGETVINDQTGMVDSTKLEVAHPDGTRTMLVGPYADGFFSEFALNNNGEVAVTLFPDKNNIDLATREIWVYSSGGAATRVEGFIGGMGMENLSFNDAGQIAVSNTDEDRAYRYTPGAGWEDLGSLDNDGFAVPRAINNSGAVTGGTSVGASSTITPFLFLDGSGMEDIPSPFGQGRAINDDFVVTGDGGWVWFPDEMRLDFVFMDQAFGFLHPRDINDHASIIGASQGFSGGTFSSAGFYWDETEGYQILTNILEDPLEWDITDAFSINNDGWILAAGTPRFEPNGVSSWLLLHPVPEPSSLALIAGAAALLLRRRR